MKLFKIISVTFLLLLMFVSPVLSAGNEGLVQVSGDIRTESTNEIKPGAKITVYWEQDGKWGVWPAQTYNNQRNPSIADVFGRFEYYVPPGRYYIIAKDDGYYEKQSSVITAEKAPVVENIYLTEASSVWILLMYVGLAVLFGAVAFFGTRAILEWKKKTDLKKLAQRTIRDQDEKSK